MFRGVAKYMQQGKIKPKIFFWNFFLVYDIIINKQENCESIIISGGIKDEKKNVSVGIGGVLVAGGLFMKAPEVAQVQAEGPEKTVSADTNPCRNTKAHFKSHELTAGAGQITVTYSAYDKKVFPTPNESLGIWLRFFQSEDANAKLEDFVNLEGELDKQAETVEFYDGKYNYIRECFMEDGSCTFTGLTNGKTYYIYANMVYEHKGDSTMKTDCGRHDMILIGSCTPVASAPSASSSGTGSSAVSGYKAYENKVAAQIEEAQPGSTIVMEKGTTTLSNSVMQELLKKGDVSLRLEFTYNGEEYIIIIPAGAALDNDIPWYGPLYLAQQFGNSAKAEAAPASGVTYAVKSGDSLNKIAAENNMTLAELLAKNPQIKDADKISVGQNINL